MTRPTQNSLTSLPGRLYNQGLAKARAQDWQGAQQDLSAALALDPGLLAAQVLLGKVLARLDRLDEAAQCWREVLARDPGHEAARAALARAQEILGQRRARGSKGRGLAAALALAGLLVGAGGMAAWQQAQRPPAVTVAALAQTPPAPRPAPPPQAPTAPRPAAVEPAPAPAQDGGALQGWGRLLAVLNEPALAGVEAAWREGRLCLSGRVARQADRQRALDLAAALAGGPAAVVADGIMVSGGLEYTVRGGDSLWGLARRFYGQGSAWGHIARHNPGHGREPLAVGSRLVIPPHPQLGLRPEAVSRRPAADAQGRVMLAAAPVPKP